MRAAIYARYSSENQRPESIEDQVAACRRLAAQRGFTILELIMVMTILVILAAMSVVSYQKLQLKAKETLLKENLRQLRKQIDQYAADKEALPQALEDLVSAQYIRDVPIDPITGKEFEDHVQSFVRSNLLDFWPIWSLAIQKSLESRTEEDRVPFLICANFTIIQRDPKTSVYIVLGRSEKRFFAPSPRGPKDRPNKNSPAISLRTSATLP